MTKTQTIQWSPFSDKHKEYVAEAFRCGMSVAEGAVRSGKTIDNCIIASMFLEICPDKFHLATGSTVANAKLNIGVCNGYGLEALFRGRCRWGKYRDNEALFIQTKTGEKIIIFSGGSKADSYKSILGNSYGLWIATEINEHFDCEDSRMSFIKVALGRQLAAKKAMVLWDLNPCNPKHRIYADYIDKYQESGLPGGYQYQLFTIYDNLSISPERMKEILAKYIPGTVWHARDILGKRCVAEGLVYQAFADAEKSFFVTKANYDYINIGVDVGGNKSFHSFVATGLKHDNSKVTALASARPPAKGTTPEDFYKAFDDFLKMVYANYGRVDTVYFESAEQVLKNGVEQRHQGLNIVNSIKNVIIERIRKENELIAQHRLYYTIHADTVRQALSEAMCNPKELDDVRLDDGTTDIDTLDAFEYSWEKNIRYL